MKLKLPHLSALKFSIAALLCQNSVPAVAQQADATPLREVIVSYAEGEGKMQLFRMQEDGSARQAITDGTSDCMMPAWSPDGQKVAYTREDNGQLNLWVCDPEGQTHKPLTKSGRNLVSSWLPDSRHLVWMVSQQRKAAEEPAANSQLWIMNTETLDARKLFGDSEQGKFSNAMPVASPTGNQVAFISDRSGDFRVWLSNLDGSNARLVSPVAANVDKALGLPIEQKVPSWSPDGKRIAHWEGVEMIHMSRFTGKRDPRRDQQISETWNVWTVSADGTNKQKVGRGDDPNWSPDGFVTRSFPDPRKGGANIMIARKEGWQELPILPPKTMRYGRFTWKPD